MGSSGAASCLALPGCRRKRPKAMIQQSYASWIPHLRSFVQISTSLAHRPAIVARRTDVTQPLVGTADANSQDHSKSVRFASFGERFSPPTPRMFLCKHQTRSSGPSRGRLLGVGGPSPGHLPGPAHPDRAEEDHVEHQAGQGIPGDVASPRDRQDVEPVQAGVGQKMVQRLMPSKTQANGPAGVPRTSRTTATTSATCADWLNSRGSSACQRGARGCAPGRRTGSGSSRG